MASPNPQLPLPLRYSLLPLIALTALAIILVLSLGARPAAGADATPISCPNNQTIWLEGKAPPNEALLIFLEARAVGGGSASSTGAYRLPLRLRERPGTYDVEVRTRGSRVVVGRFTCFVDVPIESQPTSTPEIIVTNPPTATIAPTATTLTTARPTSTSSPSPTGTNRTTTVTTTRTVGTATTRTTTPTVTTTGTPGASPTSVAEDAVQIIDVVIYDPAFPEDFEYIQLLNTTEDPIEMLGWRIINITRSDRPTYTFPRFTFDSGFTAVVYTGEGNDDPDLGEFYWERTDQVWNPGDVVELRDRTNRLISTFTVSE